jgi:hypothetical protein
MLETLFERSQQVGKFYKTNLYAVLKNQLAQHCCQQMSLATPNGAVKYQTSIGLAHLKSFNPSVGAQKSGHRIRKVLIEAFKAGLGMPSRYLRLIEQSDAVRYFLTSAPRNTQTPVDVHQALSSAVTEFTSRRICRQGSRCKAAPR